MFLQISSCQMNFQDIQKELWELSDNGVFRMSKIKDWICNYSDLHKKTYEFVHSQHLYIDYDSSTIRLPPCELPSDEEIFRIRVNS